MVTREAEMLGDREESQGRRRPLEAAGDSKLPDVPIVRNVKECPCVFSSSNPKRLALAPTQPHSGVLAPGEVHHFPPIVPGRVEPRGIPSHPQTFPS
jgi:hypothetical protein